MTSETVRQVAALPDLNHRDPEYLDLIRDTKNRLIGVYEQTTQEWHPYLLGGSGTLAVEAMITSCIQSGPALILENGYYSSRIRDIFEVHKIPFEVISHGWLESWDFERIEKKIKQGFEAVIGTHNETTTGRLNDIARLGRLCKRERMACLIDAMSSFGADEIDFTNLDAVCSSANKCLHGIPGVSFVLVASRLADAMAQFPARSYYMHLPMYAGDSPPLTPPVSALQAFRQALWEMPGEGAKARGRIYKEKADLLRTALSERGFAPAIPFDETSCTLSTFSLPRGFQYERWFQANLEFGFVLYGCKGELHDQFFQVANMGEVSLAQLRLWVGTVDRILGY
jgi:2-aminoethylphosphonate-pyruvate transaminase